MPDRYYNDRHDRFTAAQDNDVILWPYWLAAALVGIAMLLALGLAIDHLLRLVAQVVYQTFA